MAKLEDVILRDTYANIPTAGVAGRLFYATDTGNLYRDSGSAWQAYSSGVTALGGEASCSEQSISDATLTAILWDAEERDDNGFIDISSYATRFTAPADGWYTFGCTADIDTPSAASMAYLWLRVNASTVYRRLASTYSDADDNFWLSGTVVMYLEEDDYIEFYVRQDSGSALDLVEAHGFILQQG